MHWNYCNKFYLPNYMFTLHIPSSRTCKNEMLSLRCCLVTFPASPLVTYSSVFTRWLPGSPFKQKSQGAMQARSTCIIPSSLIKIHSALLYFVIIHIISIKRSLQARFFCRLYSNKHTRAWASSINEIIEMRASEAAAKNGWENRQMGKKALISIDFFYWEKL